MVEEKGQLLWRMWFFSVIFLLACIYITGLCQCIKKCRIFIFFKISRLYLFVIFYLDYSDYVQKKDCWVHCIRISLCALLGPIDSSYRNCLLFWVLFSLFLVGLETFLDDVWVVWVSSLITLMCVCCVLLYVFLFQYFFCKLFS